MPTVKRIPQGSKTPKIQSSTKSYAIPTEVNEPPDSLSDYVVCLYGAKGIGKSSLAARACDLVFMLEKRRRNLRIRQVVPETWTDFKGYLEAAIDDPSIRSISIDSIDMAYALCSEYICKEEGISHPGDMSGGKGWELLRYEFEQTIMTIPYAEKSLWMLSHARLHDSEEKVKTERFEQCSPTCKPACWRFLKEVSDFAFYYGYINQQRAITVRGEGIVWAAVGVDDTFLDPEGNPINSFYAGNSPEEAWENLQGAYANKLFDVNYIPPSSKPVLKKKK